jgi:hypothetical protein
VSVGVLVTLYPGAGETADTVVVEHSADAPTGTS